MKGVASSHSCVTCCRMQGFWPARYCRPNSASMNHTICLLRRTLGRLNLLACLCAQAEASLHEEASWCRSTEVQTAMVLNIIGVLKLLACLLRMHRAPCQDKHHTRKHPRHYMPLPAWTSLPAYQNNTECDCKNPRFTGNHGNKFIGFNIWTCCVAEAVSTGTRREA